MLIKVWLKCKIAGDPQQSDTKFFIEGNRTVIEVKNVNGITVYGWVQLADLLVYIDEPEYRLLKVLVLKRQKSRMLIEWEIQCLSVDACPEHQFWVRKDQLVSKC